MILRIVEASSCNRKNVRIRAHTVYKYVLPMVETRSYTRENISNRSYTVSNVEDVPVNRQNTATLNVCGGIALRTLKTT